MKLDALRHPTLLANLLRYRKWRLAYEADDAFIAHYLKKFSTREDDDDFILRRDITYCPAHARSAVEDVRLTIMERLPDVQRIGESTYINKPVDTCGRTINSFVGEIILPELLPMGKVGVYVDMPEELPATKIATRTPYVYIYQAENILNWYYNPETFELETVLLHDTYYKPDATTNLPTLEYVDHFRLLQLTPEGVKVTFYANDQMTKEVLLNLKQIPFVIFELNEGLMANIANYQIALLNLASSDMAFVTRANFPFYVEQYDPGYEQMERLRESSIEADEGKKPQGVGVSHGKRYTAGLNPPSFIHPSPEPIKLSMEKQYQLQTEIRLLLNLSIANIKPVRASVESKERNDRSLESGLSAIGGILQAGEESLAEIWSEYTSTPKPTIIYPQTYETRSEADRISEAERLKELMTEIPSSTYQKRVALRIAKTILGRRTSEEDFAKIEKEIEDAPNMTSSPSDVRDDVEAGLVSPEYASENLRNYPKGEVKKAEEAHAKRAARIVQAQTSVKASGNVDELNDDPSSQKLVKEGGRDNSLDDDTTKRVRGEGK